jgi:hemoglobin
MPSLFEYAGGEEGLHRMEQVFYDSVLRDPLLQPLFGVGRPTHVDHLTAFTASPSADRTASPANWGSAT